MRKAFLYGLSLAMLLSLAACHKPQAEQQDTSQPDPATTSTSADVSSPEPKPEQPPVSSVKKDTPKPTEEPPTPDPVEPEEQPSDTSQAPQTQDQPKLSAKERVENSEAFKNLQKKFPGTWVDDYGGIHSPVANGDSGDILG